MTLTQQQIARIKTLENANGRLTAPQVLADAKNKRSPLHTLFDWNVKSAAEKHWLWQAREIIGAVTIVISNETTTIRSPGRSCMHTYTSEGRVTSRTSVAPRSPGSVRPAAIASPTRAAISVRGSSEPRTRWP